MLIKHASPFAYPNRLVYGQFHRIVNETILKFAIWEFKHILTKK